MEDQPEFKLDRTIIGRDPIEDSALVFSDACGHEGRGRRRRTVSA